MIPLGIVFVVIGGWEAIRLVRQAEWREFAAFMILWSVGFVMSLIYLEGRMPPISHVIGTWIERVIATVWP